MKPIFLGGRQITSKQTNMSATDKYYGGKKKQVRKYTERQAVLLWIFRDDFIKERQAPAWYWRKQAMCCVRKESRSRQSHRQVQRARQGPADPRAQAAAQGAQGGGGGAWSGTRLGRGFPVSSAASQAGKGTAAVYGYGNTVIIMLRVP